MDVAPDVLRHRLIIGFAGRAAEVTEDTIIRHLLNEVPVP
jgi:MoxR-like ATPase